MYKILCFILVTCSFFSFVYPKTNITSKTNKQNYLNCFLPRKDSFWSEENINILTNEEKQQLAPIKEKLSRGEGLTPEEAEINIILKESVIKTKLGEEDYKNYKKLIEKRKSGMELTPEDKSKLYEIRKKLKPQKPYNKTQEQPEEKSN